MFTRAARHVVVLAFLCALFAASVLVQGPALSQTREAQDPAVLSSGKPPGPSQDARVDHARELTKLRERVAAIEGELKGFRDATTASIQATNRYTTYVTLIAGAISFAFTVLGYVGANWVKRRLAEIKTIEGEVRQIAEQSSSTVAVARAVPALLRSNLEEEDPDRKVLHAREAYHYIHQAELKGQPDSHLLNWKAYTLRRMDLRREALEAAEAALQAAKPGDGQEARALYNIACYYCVFGFGTKEDALGKRQAAIQSNEWYKPVARSDPDFESVRNNSALKERFERIVA
ncbi:MAG: TPR end-of-group domain-containing protein [Gammaproteobacteria bacterium]